MLTYQQFLAKHPRKFQGLSQAEKQRRYNDYQRSQQQPGNNARNNRKQQRQPTNQAISNRRRRARGGGLAANQRRFGIRIDPATAAFIRALADPFSANPIGLPCFPNPPTGKVRGWCRGTFAAGTQNAGFVAVVPTFASNANTCFYTTETYAVNPPTLSAVPISGQLLEQLPKNLPFSTTQFSETAVRARMVMMGLRVRYVGPSDTMNGTVVPVYTQSHRNLTGTTLAAAVNAYETYRSCPVSREWCTLLWTPVNRNELEFVHAYGPPVDHDLEAANSIQFGFFVSASVGSKFEFEVVQHTEYLGDNLATITVTPTPVGERTEQLSHIANGIAVTEQSHTPGSSTVVGTPAQPSRGFLTMRSVASTLARAMIPGVAQAMAAQDAIDQENALDALAYTSTPQLRNQAHDEI